MYVFKNQLMLTLMYVTCQRMKDCTAMSRMFTNTRKNTALTPEFTKSIMKQKLSIKRC